MESLCKKDTPEHIKEALLILGDKWSALILKQLHHSPHRYSEMEEKLSGISSRTLAKRLDMLIEKDIIQKSTFNSAKHHVYELTKKGRAMDEIIHAMAQWGKKFS